MTISDRSLLSDLEARAAGLRAGLLARLEGAERAGRTAMDAREIAMSRELEELHTAISDHSEQLERRALVDRNPVVQAIRARTGGGKLSRRLNSGARVAPIGFDSQELRHAHERLRAGEAVRLEVRDFATATPQLPAELAPWVTELQHEGRILDRLPAIGIEMPSIEIIQINSVVGSAGIVAEGAVKPEVTPQTTPLTVTAQKISAHVGLSYEALTDFEVFSNYVRIELQRQTIQAENDQLLYGTGGTGGIFGFIPGAGLTFDATTASQGIDAIEEAIAAMRVGPSLATPDLVILNPSTWSGIRRTKDTLGRYLLSADPAEDEADLIWGIPVVVTTRCHAGDGLLVDTTKYGRAVVREALSMRIGWANDDFTRNILRTVCEERLNNAIERPSAVLHITGLPLTAVAEAESAPKTAKK